MSLTHIGPLRLIIILSINKNIEVTFLISIYGKVVKSSTKIRERNKKHMWSFAVLLF